MAIKLAVCSMQIEAVKKATWAQSNSRSWPLFQAGTVTASTFHTVCHTDPSQLAASCIKGICYLDRHLTTPAMRWGIKHEKYAKAACVTSMTAEHVKFSVRDSGFVIHREYPEIGVSPYRDLLRLPWRRQPRSKVSIYFTRRGHKHSERRSDLPVERHWRELEVACKPCILLSSTVSACCLWTRIWGLCCVDTTVMPLRANNEGWKVLGGNDAQSLSLLPSRVPSGVWRSSDSCRC